MGDILGLVVKDGWEEMREESEGVDKGGGVECCGDVKGGDGEGIVKEGSRVRVGSVEMDNLVWNGNDVSSNVTCLLVIILCVCMS